MNMKQFLEHENILLQKLWCALPFSFIKGIFNFFGKKKQQSIHAPYFQAKR